MCTIWFFMTMGCSWDLLAFTVKGVSSVLAISGGEECMTLFPDSQKECSEMAKKPNDPQRWAFGMWSEGLACTDFRQTEVPRTNVRCKAFKEGTERVGVFLVREWRVKRHHLQKISRVDFVRSHRSLSKS